MFRCSLRANTLTMYYSALGLVGDLYYTCNRLVCCLALLEINAKLAKDTKTAEKKREIGNKVIGRRTSSGCVLEE